MTMLESFILSGVFGQNQSILVAFKLNAFL